MFEKAPERCEIESRTVDWRIRKYMKAFKEKSVKFDYSQEDKDLFYTVHDELGSEGAYVRKSEQREGTDQPKLTRCGFPECQKGAYQPTIIEGVPLCPDCAKKIEEDPSLIKKLKEEPSQPLKVEKKKYVPPSDWRERMRVKVSKMEFEVITELQAEGWPIDTEYWIPLTKPDGYLHEIRLPLEVDGEQVHKGKKAERDELVNEVLRRRGVEPARERFSHYSMKRKEEIKASFRERMIQGYREKGLELPKAVERGQ